MTAIDRMAARVEIVCVSSRLTPLSSSSDIATRARVRWMLGRWPAAASRSATWSLLGRRREILIADQPFLSVVVPFARAELQKGGGDLVHAVPVVGDPEVPGGP